MTNLKTTAAGVAALAPFAAFVLHMVNPEIPAPDASLAWASLATAFGLIFAQDSKPAA